MACSYVSVVVGRHEGRRCWRLQWTEAPHFQKRRRWFADAATAGLAVKAMRAGRTFAEIAGSCADDRCPLIHPHPEQEPC